jgi:NAD(P)H dehydrogenase (quinone)
VSLIVTGASGRLGQLVAAALLERVSAAELILVSRTPNRLEKFARLGATVRFGNFSQPDSLAAAFDGATCALVISTFGSADASVEHRAAFEAAARAGVRRIVYTSVTNPTEDNPFPPARVHARSERYLQSCGVEWTILRNSLYADLRVEIAPRYLQDGRWTTNIGGGSHAFVARADCADAAAAAVVSGGHGGRIYDITGPELIDANQYVTLLTEVGGRPVSQHDVGDEEYERYRTAFSADPANAAYFELFTGTGRAIRTDQMSVLANGVQLLTGRLPRALRDLLDKHLPHVLRSQ